MLDQLWRRWPNTEPASSPQTPHTCLFVMITMDLFPADFFLLVTVLLIHSEPPRECYNDEIKYYIYTWYCKSDQAATYYLKSIEYKRLWRTGYKAMTNDLILKDCDVETLSFWEVEVNVFEADSTNYLTCTSIQNCAMYLCFLVGYIYAISDMQTYCTHIYMFHSWYTYIDT